MATTATTPERYQAPRPLDPEIVALLAPQGEWSDAAYLWLTNSTNQPVEFTYGCIEVLPVPTERHQAISRYLFLALLALMQRVPPAQRLH